jgi:hypothetical protein
MIYHLFTYLFGVKIEPRIYSKLSQDAIGHIFSFLTTQELFKYRIVSREFDLVMQDVIGERLEMNRLAESMIMDLSNIPTALKKYAFVFENKAQLFIKYVEDLTEKALNCLDEQTYFEKVLKYAEVMKDFEELRQYMTEYG